MGIYLSNDTGGSIFCHSIQAGIYLSIQTGANIFLVSNLFCVSFQTSTSRLVFGPHGHLKRLMSTDTTKHIDLKRLMSKDITFCHIINERNPPHRLRTFPSHPAPVRPPLEQPKNRRINWIQPIWDLDMHLLRHLYSQLAEFCTHIFSYESSYKARMITGELGNSF